MMVTVDFKPMIREYEAAEYHLWGEPDSPLVHCKLAVCGPMGKSASSYANQARRPTRDDRKRSGYQHFPEVLFGCYLVQDEGYDPKAIVYENFVLSRTARPAPAKSPRKSAGLIRTNMRLVESVLAPAFFDEFERLARENADGKLLKRLLSAPLDLFATNASRRAAGLWEIKKINPGKKKHETFAPHQRLALAFARHLTTHRRERVLADPTMTFETGLVVYVSRQDRARLASLPPVRVEFKDSAWTDPVDPH